MPDFYSGLRCRPGDLAVIVRDEPECQANIGQVVQIIEWYTEFPDEWGFFWLVQPLSERPSPVIVEDIRTRETRLDYDCEPRAHLDAWLRPLKDEMPDDQAATTSRAKAVQPPILHEPSAVDVLD